MHIFSVTGGMSLENVLFGPQGVVPFLRSLTTDRARGFRVMTLVVAVMAMSVGDLFMTLTYATSTGMVELNPVARMLMQTDNPIYIILYKFGSVVLACAILASARKTRVGELGTWLAFFGLLWLSIRWVQYSEAMEFIAGHVHHLAAVEQGNWVEMRPEQ